MPGGYKDTISSGSSYYNNHFRMDHDIVKGYSKIKAANYAAKIDTIQTSQQKLEKALQSQLQSHSVILFVATVGRYMVLALVLPPYYLCFEGPRWVLINLQPWMEAGFEKAEEVLLLMVTFTVDLWANFAKKMAFQLIKKPKKYIKQKFEVLQETLRPIKVKIAARFEKVLKPITKGLERFQNFIKAARESREKGAVRLKQLPVVLKQQLSHFSKKRAEVFKFFKENIQWIQWPRMPEIPYPIALTAQVISKGIEKSVHTCLQVIRKGLQVTKQVIKSVAIPARAWVKSKIIHPIIESFRLAIVPLEKIQIKIKETFKPIQKQVVMSIQAAAKAAQAYMSLALLPLQKLNPGFRSLNLIQKAKEVFSRIKQVQPPIKRLLKFIFDQGKKYGNQAFLAFQKQLKKALNVAETCLNWCAKQVMRLPPLFAKLWNYLKQAALKMANKALASLRVVVGWTRVVLRYSVANLWD